MLCVSWEIAEGKDVRGSNLRGKPTLYNTFLNSLTNFPSNLICHWNCQLESVPCKLDQTSNLTRTWDKIWSLNPYAIEAVGLSTSLVSRHFILCFVEPDWLSPLNSVTKSFGLYVLLHDQVTRLNRTDLFYYYAIIIVTLGLYVGSNLVHRNENKKKIVLWRVSSNIKLEIQSPNNHIDKICNLSWTNHLSFGSVKTGPFFMQPM